MHLKNLRDAFTLIELLIVVAIISILAAIAVPNFLHAQIRAKVAHCVANMRTVAFGMEAYHADFMVYPPVRGTHLSSEDGAAQTLTTPIAYLSSLPENYFEPEDDWNVRHQWQYGVAPAREGWCLESSGPDLKEDPPEAFFYMQGINTQQVAFLLASYDPTNGLRSSGDIVRFGP